MLKPIGMSESIDLKAYFARIGYDGSQEPTLETLKALHALHPRAIPFENLDVLLKRPVRLDPMSLQRKLIESRRGGYCFEQNGLFAHVLRAIGFDVAGYAARVQWMMPAERVGPRTHMLLKVELVDGPWLVDVGFGGLTKTAPIMLKADREQDTGRGWFRLIPIGDELQVQAKLPDGWFPMYQFAPIPQEPVDYELANWFVSTHEASPFTANLIAAWVAADRRYGLFNNQLSIHHEGGETEKRVLSASELDQLLHDTFGIGRAEGTAELYARLCALPTINPDTLPPN